MNEVKPRMWPVCCKPHEHPVKVSLLGHRFSGSSQEIVCGLLSRGASPDGADSSLSIELAKCYSCFVASAVLQLRNAAAVWGKAPSKESCHQLSGKMSDEGMLVQNSLWRNGHTHAMT